MFKSDVICIGSATLDSFLTINQRFKSINLGDKLLVKGIEKHSGGGATNAAAALSKMGLKVKVLTKLGNDHDADFILKELRDYKIKNICLHHSKKNTDSSIIISSTLEKDRVIYVHKGASLDLLTTDFDKKKFKTKWVYLSSLIGKSFHTAEVISLYCKKNKIGLLFNPSLYIAKKGKIFLKMILEATKILVLNKKEAQALLKTKNNNCKFLLKNLSKLGPEKVVITNGPKTLYAFSEGNFYSLVPPNDKVVHTAGAGDAFASTLLGSLIKKYSFEDSLKLAQRNSCSVIQHIGTKNKLLTEKELVEGMKKIKVKKC